MVLLPSALPCDSGGTLIHPRPHKPVRPNLPIFDRYEPSYRTQSPVLGLIASCRALHSMIGERFLPSPNLLADTTTRAQPFSNPFDPISSSLTPPSPIPQRSNKRRRDEFESQDTRACCRPASPRKRQNISYSTPKPRCAAPLVLPLGLQVSDFEALQEPTYATAKLAKARKRHYRVEIEMPLQEESHDILSSPQKNMIWTANDDRLLVETVLSKLNLSPQEWNECARSLGKDKDSLGRRWQLLIGGGNVGLRRGAGRYERTDLDIQSW